MARKGLFAASLASALCLAAGAFAADGPFQSRMKTSWQQYQQASNGFHPADIAKVFQLGAENFTAYAQNVDNILAFAADGRYKSVEELQDVASEVLQTMTIQRNVLAASLQNAIVADAQKVAAVAKPDQPALERLEVAQEQADADFLRRLEVMMVNVNQAFAAAERDLPNAYSPDRRRQR